MLQRRKKMRVLVTGATGFVGRHVISALERAGHTSLELNPGKTERVDLREAERVRASVREQQPDACIHLGGIAFVPTCQDNPALAFEVNAIGTVNLLEAFRHEKPDARVLVVSSSQIYGEHHPGATIDETAPMHPRSVYAITKLGADQTARLYAREYDMPVLTARPQNHIGPGQTTDFVATAFADQLIRIARGEHEGEVLVGNLESRRSFLDVRDVVRGYLMLLEGGRPGEGYNLAPKTDVCIQDIFDQLCAIVGVKPTTTIDPEKFRPTDQLPLLDSKKIQSEVGWEATIPLKQTLRDIVDDLHGCASKI